MQVVVRLVSRDILCLLSLAVVLTAGEAVAQGRVLGVEREAVIQGEFTYFGGAATDRAGNLLVSQPSDRQLILVPHAERGSSRLGRLGEGPGEFRNVAHVGATKQGFWAYDAILRRVSTYSSTGTLGGTMSIPADILKGTRVGAQTMVMPSLLAVIGQDSVLLTATGSATAALGGIGLGERHFFVGRNGTDQFRRIASLPATPGCALSMPNSTVTLPNCAVPRVLARPDGQGLVFVTAMWNPQATVVVQSLDLTGKTVYRRIIPMSPPRVEREVMDTNTARLKRRFPTVTIPTLPTYYPPLTSAIVGSDGTVWLGVRDNSETSIWKRLDPSGKDGGYIVLPKGTRLIAADGGTVWAVSLDEDDVPSLVRFRIPALLK